MLELPAFGMRAYALLFTRHGTDENFGQRDLEWIVSESMRKKIFALLVKSGWIKKMGPRQYRCISPEKAVTGLLQWRVPDVLKKSVLPYALCGLSAVEVWSDFSYVLRGMERSPYFVQVQKNDLKAWQLYLNAESVPHFTGQGSTVGEFVILVPVRRLQAVERHGFKVQPVETVLSENQDNALFDYAIQEIRTNQRS